MFGKLIETNARRERSVGGALASLVLHGGLIGLAVAATASAGDRVPEAEPETVEFVDTPRPEEPPPPPPEPVHAPPPPDLVAAPPVPKGFPVLEAPMEVPDVIPEIDLSRRPIDASEFTGVGVPGGRPDGVEGAAPAPVVDPAHDYLVHEVDRPVAPVPGHGAPVYPAMLRASGVTGRVVARFVVDTAGRVEVASFEVVESSHELFTAAVRRALPAMRFVPAEMRGRRVRQLVQQPFVFEVR